jgi:hypothetical protein
MKKLVRKNYDQTQSVHGYAKACNTCLCAVCTCKVVNFLKIGSNSSSNGHYLKNFN